MLLSTDHVLTVRSIGWQTLPLPKPAAPKAAE